MPAKRTAAIATLVVGVALTATAVGQMNNSATAPIAAPTASVNTLAAARVNHFLGTVGTSNRSHHWFTMRTTSNRTVRVYITGGTKWHGCGWGYMRRGNHIDVRVYSHHTAWFASRIQNWASWNHHEGDSDHHGMMR
jgi:hypothetical protein